LKKWVPVIGRRFRGLFRDPRQLEKPLPACLAAPPLQKSNLPLSVSGDLLASAPLKPNDLEGYLVERENCADDILKMNTLLMMPHVLLEIGCGNAEAARQIALMNPGTGVIATDLYDWSHQLSTGPCYGRVAAEWRRRGLPIQTDTPSNLVVLRADAALLHFLPERSIDTVVLINPEPEVGKSFLNLLQVEDLSMKIKKSPLQIVILPYSRELGVMACGGCGFEHDPDWFRGLGFIMGSGLLFKRAAPLLWGIDLGRLSPYSGNSTQGDIYVYGEPPELPVPQPIVQERPDKRR
jgi:hypothetical protein